MLNLYTEAVVEEKSATPASKLEFQIPRYDRSYNKSKFSARDRTDISRFKDEKTYSEECLATSGSFYFRQNKSYPRTFQWRVIADRKILEIQPADVARSEKDHKEAYLTLSFEFQDRILPLGLTFADPTNADELDVFVCTSRNEIFNLRLATSFFRSPQNISQTVSDWCKTINTTALTIDTIYNVYASSPFEIFVAYTSGKIQKLNRKQDGEIWAGLMYDDNTWGSTLRGIVSRRGAQTIEYGNTRLSLSAAQGMVASPDTTYLYTLCLNHSLRIWHLPSGRLVDTRDLLDVARDPNEKIQLNPNEPGLIRFVRHSMSKHPMLATYTPHEGGQFKFWNLKGGLIDQLAVEDKHPDSSLIPPDPDPTGNSVWSLIGFEVVPGRDSRPSTMWVLWRNNNYHQIYTLHFDFQNMPEDWKRNWSKVASYQSKTRAPDLIIADAQDVTAKWLEFLSFPGRYSSAVLETALVRYQKLTGSNLSSFQRNKPLQERLCLTVASSVWLRKYEGSEMDYERFTIDTDHQWRNLWRILENMNDSRLAPLSLAYDAYSDMAWVCMADAYAGVRECSKIELLRLNDASELENINDIVAERWSHRKVADDKQSFEKACRIMHAARKFHKSFSPEMMHELWISLEEEMYNNSEVPVPDRIVVLFNQIGFSEGLSEGAEQQLVKDLEAIGGIDAVSSEIFYGILDLLATSGKRPKSSLKTTLFGSNLFSAALLDTILSDREVLLDLLILTIFIDESEYFDPSELFEQIIPALKEQERNLWLATHFRLASLEFSSQNDPLELTIQNGRSVSILEDTLTKRVRPAPTADRPLMFAVTDLIAETQVWISGKDAVSPEDAAVHLQCDMIAHGEIDYASDFLRFQPSTAWATYVKGRLRFARAEYNEASLYFRKAAYTLACGKAVGNLTEMSSGLLSMLDAERFNSGLPRYFEHIMDVFETAKSYTHVAEFSQLSLQSLTPGVKEPVPNFKSGILSRLFTAELRCARFESAYEALVQFSDTALQKSSATALVNAIVDPSVSTRSALSALEILERLPWSLHPQLASHLDRHLASLAKKQSTVRTAGVQYTTSSAVDYLSILHALRVAKNDYRGATSVLFDRLQIIQRSGRARSDPQATALRHALLTLINTMTCVSSDEAYIVADVDNDPRTASVKRARSTSDQTRGPVRKRKRLIITLDDLRRQYQQVLDRCSRIERGDFDFEVDEDLSEDEDEQHGNNTYMNGSRLSVDVMEM